MSATRRVTWSGATPSTADEARARILDAAVRCVNAAGVERTSTTLIAREAGVSRPTLYAYFANREEIVEQAAEQAVLAIIERLQEHCRTFTRARDRAVEAMLFSVSRIRSEPAMAVYFEPGRVRLGPLAPDELFYARKALEPAAEKSVTLRRSLDDAAELFARTLISLLTRQPARPRTAEQDRAFLRRWFPRALGIS